MKKIIVSFLILFFPLISYGAIAFDNAASVENATVAGVSYTVTGTNPVIIMSAKFSSACISATMSYGGVSMTEVATVSIAHGENIHTFALIAPTTGGASFGSWGGTGCTNVNNAGYTIGSYSGVGAIDVATAQAFTSGTTQTKSITTTTANDWVVAQAVLYSGGASASTNVTLRSSNFSVFTGDSNGTVSIGSYSQTYVTSETKTATNPFLFSQIALTPVVIPPPTVYGPSFNWGISKWTFGIGSFRF